jgi:flagellar L-ring protein precursor FlgH
MMHRALLAALLLPLAACSDVWDDVGRAPQLSPVGSGLENADTEIVTASYPSAEAKDSWIGGEADFFRDRKARRHGDIITVLIDIDDKASLNNNSNRTRKSNSDNSVGISYPFLGSLGTLFNGEAEAGSNTSSTGQGTTARSEKVSLSVAAVVTEVLPNGFLVIQGSQEVLVNYEARALSVSGIVNPKEISSDNRIAYDRIAEARISYGGKGRLTEIQQPPWGQQLWDRVTPF